MDLLKTMSPAAIDGEFRSLAPEAGGSLEQLGHLMHFLLEQLKTNRNFELVESYLGLFLKVCGNLHVGTLAIQSKFKRNLLYRKKLTVR